MNHSRPFRLLCYTLLALACISLSAGSALGQEYRGTVLGRVTDSHGAAIAGATVTVTNEQTNVSSKAVTESDGGYNVPFLIPGTYQVTVDSQGFKKYVQSGITVAISQRATVNVEMQVGAVEQSVTITADAPLLDTTTGSLGQVVDRQKVEALPLNGRMI